MALVPLVDVRNGMLLHRARCGVGSDLEAIVIRFLTIFFPEMASDDQAATLDHVKVKRKRRKKDWRDEAVKRAAERHGKAFECGPDGVPRKIVIDKSGTVVVKSEQSASVTPIKKAKARS